MAQYEVTLRDYWRILRRRKGIVLFTAFLLGFFSFVIASVWQPQPLFEARSKVQINLHQNLTGLYLQTIAYNSGDAIETQQTILTSHPVLRRTAQVLGMLNWAKTPADTALVLTDLAQRIKTSQEGFTNIIAVSATDPVPERARDLANGLVRTYREYDHELKNQQAVRHREFVERQRDQARLALAESEEQVRLYREKSELISLDSQASVNLQGMTASERSMQSLQQDLASVSTLVDEMKANEALSERTLQGASVRRVGETFMALSRQLNDLKLQRDALLVKFTEDHPNVRQVQVRIDQLGRDLKGELTQRRAAIQRDLEAERVRLAELRKQYNTLPSQGLVLSRLEREVAMRQQVVMVLEENFQEALIREADKVEEVTILEWALTPAAPVNPHHPLRRAVMGVLLGLVLGVVFAVVAETLDTSIGTIEDVQEYTGTQVVGIIPFINVDDVRASMQRRGVDVSDERAVQRKAQLVAYFDPQSTLAETYRTLRTNIEFVTVEKGAKCIMVSSSMHYEGKSTTIANLSMTMAQLGKRTLLVDCDLRKPSMARLFGLDKEPGVTEVVVGNYKWPNVVRTVTDIVTGDMAMEDILQTQGISNLHIITSGSIPPNPAELLNSRQMGQFFAEIREAYDIILVDTPPILHVTDAAILGKKMDGALMVYKAGDVARTSLKRSTALLRSVDIDLLGIVLNGIRAEMSSDYQDLGYNAYYAYGSEVASPERTTEQRFQDWTRRWKKRLGLGEDDVPRHEQTWAAGEDHEPEEAEEAEDFDSEEADDERGAHPVRRALSYVALIVVAAGALWRSGAVPMMAGDGDDLPPTPTTVAAVVSEPLLQAPVVAAARAAEGMDGPARVVVQPVAASAETPRQGAPRQGAPRQGAPRQLDVARSERPYTVRLASYPPGSRWAATMLTTLRQRGQPAFLSPVQVKDERYERLLVGRFANWDDAYQHARDLREAGVSEEFTILHLPYMLVGMAAELADFDDYKADHGARQIGAFASAAEAEAFRSSRTAAR